MLYAGYTEHEVRYDCVERILRELKKCFIEFYDYVYWEIPAWERDGYYDCDHCYEEWLVGKMTSYIRALELIGYCEPRDRSRCNCVVTGRTRKHAWKNFLKKNIFIEE